MSRALSIVGLALIAAGIIVPPIFAVPPAALLAVVGVACLAIAAMADS